MWFKGRRIILGVTGSIAAYKSAFLLRELVKAGAEVQVIMTKSASGFITPLTMATLSGKPVLTDVVKDEDTGTWTNHVDLALWADAVIVAPASSNTLAKMASAQSDNLLLLTFLSAKCPVFFAPAMDLDMHAHEANQLNISKLQDFGHILLPSELGELASGLSGFGRMAEPLSIISQINDYFVARLPFTGKKVLVTAGPTYERIDPVRFIGNFSSGKMGFAIAEELASRGAEVVLVAGPVHLKTSHPLIQRVDVESAGEMFEACKAHFSGKDIVIMSAAVADYRPEYTHNQKIKKSDTEMSIGLVRNPDILKWLGQHKESNQHLVGFALETENAVDNAISKLKAKNLDLIVLNSLEDSGAGFAHDTNKVTFISAENKTQCFELKSKTEVAKDLVDYLQNEMK